MLLGNGDGTFQSRVTYSAPLVGGVAVGDVTGDRVPDLVAANGDAVSVLANRGDGTLAAAVDYPTGHAVGAIAAGSSACSSAERPRQVSPMAAAPAAGVAPAATHAAAPAWLEGIDVSAAAAGPAGGR